MFLALTKRFMFIVQTAHSINTTTSTTSTTSNTNSTITTATTSTTIPATARGFSLVFITDHLFAQIYLFVGAEQLLELVEFVFGQGVQQVAHFDEQLSERTEHLRDVVRRLVHVQRPIGENSEPSDDRQPWDREHKRRIVRIHLFLLQQPDL
uniref:Putative secreted peptide n=1 Tax=Anopheles braziliensis TaxID=58242 RepID=A0A2M3ZNE4_9DIPT